MRTVRSAVQSLGKHIVVPLQQPAGKFLLRLIHLHASRLEEGHGYQKGIQRTRCAEPPALCGLEPLGHLLAQLLFSRGQGLFLHTGSHQGPVPIIEITLEMSLQILLRALQQQLGQLQPQLAQFLLDFLIFRIDVIQVG